jgi:hypothetical protein
MNEPTYRVRAGLFDTERTYALTDDAVVSPGGRTIRFADIASIRFYDVPGADMAGGGTLAAGARRCVIWPRHGRALVLASAHYRSFGNVEDRSASFLPFVAALIERVTRRNPDAVFLTGMPVGLWWTWASVLVLLVAVVVFIGVAIVMMIAEGDILSFDLLSMLLSVLAMIGGAASIVVLLLRSRSRSFRPSGGGDA